jgi:hypothetical protein
MSYGLFWILVEGPDDSRFVNSVFKVPLEALLGLTIQVWEYSRETNDWVNKLLTSISAMNARYVYVGDIADSPCVTAKKSKVHERFPRIDSEQVVVAVKEIESWYLAGLDDSALRDLGVKHRGSTDKVNKEQLRELMPPKFDSNIDFMIEMLKPFSPQTACDRNKSFRYFYEKYIGAKTE